MPEPPPPPGSARSELPLLVVERELNFGRMPTGASGVRTLAMANLTFAPTEATAHAATLNISSMGATTSVLLIGEAQDGVARSDVERDAKMGELAPDHFNSLLRVAQEQVMPALA